MIKLLGRNKNLDFVLRNINLQSTEMAKLQELINNLSNKVNKLETVISNIDSASNKLEQNKSSNKTRETIQLLLRKHSQLTAERIGELLNLSRTRACEYLIEMERNGTVKSVVIQRKKFYMIN